jgi:glycosyltransferase involved in cell wall biosynthesis
MKTLFVGNPSEKLTDGGSATFQRALQLRISSIPDSLYLAPTLPGRNEVLHAVHKYGIDLVWYLSPYYEVVPVPFVATVWDLAHRQMPYFPEVSTAPGAWRWESRESYYQYVLPRAARVIVSNIAAVDSVHLYGVQDANIRTIPLCVDVEALRASGSFPDQGVPPAGVTALGLEPQKYLLYPAQFWPHKNHITLVDMLKILQDRGHDLKLVFTGADKGNQSFIEDYVKGLGLQDEVIFTGFVSTDTLHQLYRNAFALVFASLLGPDNLPPLEAMALDCPVICSRYPGAREQLGNAALYFDPLDAIDAADQVLDLVESSVYAQTLIQAGREWVKQFTPDRYIESVRSVLREFERTRRLWGTAYRHL